MKYLCTIFFILFTLSGQAQHSLIRISVEKWEALKAEELSRDYLKLPLMSESPYKFHFRFSINDQTIHLYSNNGKHFTGKVVERIIENKIKKNATIPDLTRINYIYMVSSIDPSKADSVGQYMLENEFYSIPTDTSINHWNFNWGDCRSNYLKMKIDSQVFTKSFDCLKNQEDSIAYVIQLKQFNHIVYNTLNLKDYHYLLLDKLKPNKRYTNGYWITMISSKSRSKRISKNREKIEYLNTMIDSIDARLEHQLDLLIPDKDVYYTSDYQITISSKRRLKRVKVKMNFWKRFANLEYIKWKRKIRKAFRQIDLTFIQPELAFKFKRGLSINTHDINLYTPVYEFYY